MSIIIVSIEVIIASAQESELMFSHRFSTTLPETPKRNVASTSAAGAFVVCPMALWPATPQELMMRQDLYERAYREALAVVRPSRLERLEALAIN
jgi:hypothetical protein